MPESSAAWVLPHKVKRVLVCGSRGWKDEERVYEVLSELSQRDEIEVLHGGAEGADSAALWASLDLDITSRSFLPNYKEHGAAAPHVRNDLMLSKADLVVAFWDGESKGTKSVIEKARKRGIPVEVIRG